MNKKHQPTLFCKGCQQDYKTPVENIQYMLMYHSSAMTIENGIYHYSGGCFFKTLGKLKREERVKERSSD